MGSLKLTVDASEVAKSINSIKDRVKSSYVRDIFERNARFIFVNNIQRRITVLNIIDTGALRRSIYSKMESFTMTGFKLTIGAGVKYAAYQEYGTKRGIKPRPYLLPTIVEQAQNYFNACATELKDRLFAKGL